jgi:hypothetical protein
MKKAFTIFLTFIVFLFSCGFSLAVSYCPMSEEWNFSLVEKKSCCCEDDMGCCSETQIQIEKITDNYFPSDFSKIPAGKILDLNTVPLILQQETIAPQFISLAHHYTNDPPGKSVIPLSILLRVIII